MPNFHKWGNKFSHYNKKWLNVNGISQKLLLQIKLIDIVIMPNVEVHVQVFAEVSVRALNESKLTMGQITARVLPLRNLKEKMFIIFKCQQATSPHIFSHVARKTAIFNKYFEQVNHSPWS